MSTTESVRFRFIHTSAGARVVNTLLALTILVSPIALIEPSPYEGMVLVLAVVAFALGLPFERRIQLLLIVLLAWVTGGFLSLLPAFSDDLAVRYLAISVYLALTTVVFACLFAEDTTGRLAVVTSAYVVAALGVSLLAIAAYFGAVPNAETFMSAGRAAGSFKDPNVFGPFLIPPLLLLIARMIYRGIGIVRLMITLVILFGLLLSFSRGAWGHFLLSAILMMALLFVTEGQVRFRRRLILATVAAVAGIAVLLAIALSIPAVREMFEIRAQLLQYYDVGESTDRFNLQRAAIAVVLEEPNGAGPLQFGRRFGQDVHNVYLNSFLAYGWIGGFAYWALVASTLVRGFRAILRGSPWRVPLVAIYASFVGVAAEGMIVDTDHWRHFFLLVGLIWGVSAAAAKYRSPWRQSTMGPDAASSGRGVEIEWSGPSAGTAGHRRGMDVGPVTIERG